MEIGPIPGIRLVSTVKSPPGEQQLPAVFDIEHPSEPDDDTYSGSSDTAPGGQDEEEMNQSEQEPKAESLEQSPSGIDLIA